MKKSMDFEYSTNWYEEVKFLSNRGIRYAFVKPVEDATVWKYKKCAELFSALAEFYNEVYGK